MFRQTFRVSIDEVAPDARQLVQAFREGGAIPYGETSVEIARASYQKSCALNGLASIPLADVQTISMPVTGGNIRLRIYSDNDQRGSHAKPFVFFIHGGGWVIGDLDTHDTICRFLAKRTGLAVVAVEYRLAPEHRYPIPLQDCREALRYTVRNASKFGFDGTRAILVGDSAGANMAAVITNDPQTAPKELSILCQVLLYPVTDLTMSTGSHRIITDGFPLTAASMRWFADQYVPNDVDRKNVELSPLLNEKFNSIAPAFIVTVGHDPLREEGIAYAAKMANHGLFVAHYHLPNHMHGIFTAAGKISSSITLLQEVCKFVTRISNAE